MMFTFYFFISWLLFGLFLFNRVHKHASIKEVTLLLLLSSLINTNTYVGLFDAFKWMRFTTDKELFIAVLIYKNVFIPLFISCFTLLIDQSLRFKKILFYILYSMICLSIDVINILNGLYYFKTWNHFYTFIYYSIFLWFLFFTLKWFRGLASSSGGENHAVD